MSRPRPYTYPGMPASSQPYYYDEMEGYIEDYSESEGLSDGTSHLMPGGNPDVTELYRRKALGGMIVGQNQYNHFLHGPPPEYYYETVDQPHLVRRKPYRKRMPVIAEQPRFYSPDRQEIFSQSQIPYRSSHQLVTSLPRTAVPATIPSATVVRPAQAVRRHPITVRTPRYYRRPAGPALVKRPSTLCLPIGCQPDPAVYSKRTKRISPEQQLYPPEYVFPQQSQSKHHPHYNVNVTEKVRSPSKKMPTSDFELNITRSKLDAALERYEHIFERNVTEFAGNPPDLNLVRMIKPKVPPTIKENQEKRFKQQKPQADPEEITPETLEDVLFADLQANGFTNNESGDFKRPTKETTSNTNNKKDDKTPRSTDGTIGVSTAIQSVHNSINNLTSALQSEKSVKDLPKSFNYQEIQNNVAKTHQSQVSENSTPRTNEDIPEEPFEIPDPDLPINKDLRNVESVTVKNPTDTTLVSANLQHTETFSRPHLGSQTSSQRLNDNDRSAESLKSLRAATVPRVLVDDALELHRTKSYVVNLIDHALSNHFGTNLCEKYSTKENPIDHRVAVEILKKHSAGKMDKELCVEIAQALADTFNSSTTSCTAANQNQDCEPKQQTSSCSCSKISDEPLYVKQLKQLRWGHLKHIQREVRRLEDLERFLDSCSSNSYV